MHKQSVLLIVDDEPVGRTAFQALLGREGYRLEFAPDGPSALRLAEQLSPDLILLDVMMPGMDGFEVTRRVRSLPALAEVPILLVTALDDPSSRLTGIEAGADDFLSKPFDRTEMRARVRSILRLNRFRSLTHEREKYQRLFERCPCGLLVVGPQGDVVEANSVAGRLLTDWLTGPPPWSLFHLLVGADADRLRRMLAGAAADPAVVERGEFMALLMSGQNAWFELTVSAFAGGPGGPAGQFQVALSDRTSERLLEEELRQAQKIESVGQLAGAIAHDFNNLLTVINGYSGMALNRMPAGDPSRDQIEQVYKAGERAAALTRQLLAFTRREALLPVELDLNELLRDVSRMLRRLIGEHITVRTVLAPSVGRIKADPGQVEQVLFNLAVNARDAMPQGGVFTIETQDKSASSHGEAAEDDGQAAARWVRLLVDDTGCGMPPEVMARAFEPFFTTKERGKGTGLGLATVYGIVQQCGGRVRVASEVGRGTRFTIDFPRVERTVPAPAPVVSAFQLKQGQETVLVAEDEDSVRLFATAAMGAAGYTVLSARDGEEALRVSQEHGGPIHLLLTDAVMPKLSGQALARQVVRQRPEIKVLYASGYDDDVMTQHGAPVGQAALLPKPYTATRLLNKVREVLDQ